MSDIVERLRSKVFSGPTMEASHTKTLEWQAAAEIERLRIENKEQQASIQHLLDLLATDRAARILQGKDIAELSAEVERLRAALEGKE